MGLDTFAVRGSEDHFEYLTRDEAESVFAGIKLAGQDVLETGPSSFRGRHYNELVEWATGVSLYQEWIGPETVAEMADAFDRWLREDWPEERAVQGGGSLRLVDQYLLLRDALVREPGSSPESSQEKSVREFAEEELRALNDFLRICKERGYGLYGWF